MNEQDLTILAAEPEFRRNPDGEDIEQVIPAQIQGMQFDVIAYVTDDNGKVEPKVIGTAKHEPWEGTIRGIIQDFCGAATAARFVAFDLTEVTTLGVGKSIEYEGFTGGKIGVERKQ